MFALAATRRRPQSTSKKFYFAFRHPCHASTAFATTPSEHAAHVPTTPSSPPLPFRRTRPCVRLSVVLPALFAFAFAFAPPLPSPRRAVSSAAPTPPMFTSPSSLPPARSETPQGPWRIVAPNQFCRDFWSPLRFYLDLFIPIVAYLLLLDVFLVPDTPASSRPTPPALLPIYFNPSPRFLVQLSYLLPCGMSPVLPLYFFSSNAPRFTSQSLPVSS